LVLPMHTSVQVDLPLISRSPSGDQENVLGNGVVRSPLASLAFLPTTEELAGGLGSGRRP
jgi:hypothetical protein